MKLIGYIKELKVNSFTIPVYADESGNYYFHDLDATFNITGFTTTSIQGSFLKKLYSHSLYETGNKGAVVFVGEDNYLLFDRADIVIQSIISYLNHDVSQPAEAIKKEVLNLKQSLEMPLFEIDADLSTQQSTLSEIKTIHEDVADFSFDIPSLKMMEFEDHPIHFELSSETKDIIVNAPVQIVPMTELNESGAIKYSLEEYMEIENDLLQSRKRVHSPPVWHNFSLITLLHQELGFESIDQELLLFCIQDCLKNEYKLADKIFDNDFLTALTNNIVKHINENNALIDLPIEKMLKVMSELRAKKLSEYYLRNAEKTQSAQEVKIKNIQVLINANVFKLDQKISNQIFFSNDPEIYNYLTLLKNSAAEIDAYLNTLTQIEADIICLYYGLDVVPMSMEDISKVYRITLTATRRIKESALRKWKKDKKRKILQLFDICETTLRKTAITVPVYNPELIESVKLQDIKSSKKLFKDYQWLIILLAMQQQNDINDIEVMDKGTLALMLAATYFNPSREHGFIPYATWWIRRSMLEIPKEYPFVFRIKENLFEEISPMEMSIEETLKFRADERRRKLKEFNYSFHSSPSRIEEFEKEPAYKRLGIDISHMPDRQYGSRISLDKDSNGDFQLRSNNSFLHDNVD